MKSEISKRVNEELQKYYFDEILMHIFASDIYRECNKVSYFIT